MSLVQVIASEGEQKSSKALKEAADVLSTSPAAIQLRYLQVKWKMFPYIPNAKKSKWSLTYRFICSYFQTLNSIANENNSTVIFPIPLELMSNMTGDNIRRRKNALE